MDVWEGGNGVVGFGKSKHEIWLVAFDVLRDARAEEGEEDGKGGCGYRGRGGEGGREAKTRFSNTLLTSRRAAPSSLLENWGRTVAPSIACVAVAWW